MTNLEAMEGDAIIRWHRGRYGKSEEVYRILKSDLAGGGHVIPHRFEANVFWWDVTVVNVPTLLNEVRQSPERGKKDSSFLSG